MIFHKKYILIKSKKLCFGKSLKGSCQAAPVGLTSWSVAPVRRTGLKGLHTELHAWQSLFSVLSSFNKGLLIFALYWASQIIEPVLSLGLRSLKRTVSLLWVIETKRWDEQIWTKDLSTRESHLWNFSTVSPVPPGVPVCTLCPSDSTMTKCKHQWRCPQGCFVN